MCETSEEIIDLSLQEYAYISPSKELLGFLGFFCLCFSPKFSEPATKTHFEPCKYSSLCPESCETTDSYLQARHLITEIWEQHASPPSFITLPPLGSTRCDSISGRLVEIATRQRCLIDGGGACQLPQPFPVSYKILLFFFFYHFLFDFLFHQVHLYRTGWSQVILRWQTLI